MTCDICKGKRYLISERDDGRRAVERCDECSTGTLNDEDAAKLAIADGIKCATTYPCYLEEANG